MLRRLFAIHECARCWREEQSRAIDERDLVRAVHAEECAERFEAYLSQGQIRTTRGANPAPPALPPRKFAARNRGLARFEKTENTIQTVREFRQSKASAY
jgi:hypothetical protein